MSKRKFFILILFSLLLSFVTIKGQIIPWQATQSSGMNIQAMASLSDVIIAGAYGDGIYFSFNDGIDWIQRNNGITNLGILSLVVKEQFIFTGTNGGGIYRSNNVGQDWAATNSGLSNLIVKSLLVFGERIFAGTDGGLFVSTNSGDNWVASGAGLEGNSIGSLAHNNQKIYAGTENGIFVSTDLGASWSESGLSGKNIRTISAQNEIIYAGAAGEGVYFSSDFGQNWLQINNGLTNGYIFSLLLDDDRVFAGSEGTGIFTGKLHENYWTSINSGLASLYVRSFLKYQDKIYAGTNDGIYFIPRQTFGTIQLITPNGGEIWYPGNINRIEWEAEELNLITIELSINNGTSWVVIAENVSADSGFYNWIIPKVSSDSCLLRLSADFYPSIYTISESNFAIQNTFTEIASFFTSAQLNANWGDYDNDGLMDIAISGSTDQGIVTKIIKNLGSGNFEERINLFGIFGRNYWGDFDNDNDLDLLVSGGTGGSNYTKLFRNNGDDSFTEISTNFPNIDGFCNWGDSDNDGDLDLVVTGLGILTARLYINNSDGTFSMQTLEMPTSQCKSKWADCDRDGDLDLIFYDGGQFKIFTNGGNNYFSGGSHYNIGSMWYGDLDIGDYNNDGNLDFLIVGGVGQNTAKVYRNNGNWTFTNTFTGHGVESSSADWGDYNNDGYLDFVISGTDDNDTERTKLYSNLNGQTFVEDTSFIFPGASQGSVRWADYDNDGDLDLLLCGTGIGLKIYRNNSVIKNTLPTQCTDLTFQAQTDGVQLSWTSGNDAQTPTNGLNYNLVIGSSSGEYDIMSPMADLGTGKRMLREIGNSLTSSWKIEGIDPGIYYWSVQTIDGSLEAAEFAPEQIFSFDVPYIHLLTPNGGETWRAGEQHDIKWLSESVSNVKLDFTTDNGSTWTNIATGLNAISGTFQWTVPSVNSDKVAVRITDEDFTNTTDESDSSFTIINPILMLIAPNGGEVWRAGENKVITWNAENISTLRIEYSTDSGNQWELISAGIQAQQGEYHWIIPDGYSINCLVKISDENIPEVYDSSDTTFAIMPAISQNYSIAFNEQNNEYIDGMTEERIQGNNPFTIEFWIKISQTNFQPIINRGSNSSSWVYNFYIQGNIYFGIRTEQNRYINCPISVAVWHHVAGVRSQDGNLKLFIDGVFQTENFIGQESLVYSDAQLRFAKYLDPDFHPNFKLSKIRISSTARYNENFIPSIYYTKDENTIGLWNFHEGTGNILVDESGNGIHGMISGNPLWDTDVPIVPYLNLTSPNGGENWRSGELQNITWTADNISTIKLEYTTNDETNWTSITTGQTASNGTFAWTVPTINSTTVKIKVSDEVFPHSSDESDAEFTIHGPTLTLTAPNGNETWLAGEVRDIKWTSDNISTVKLEYTTNNGINWTGITAGHTASTGTYAWTVPSINKTNVKVKVTDEVFPNISDESDGSFTIQFPPLTLTAPNGGETWRAGELRDITWTASNISTVKLEYTTNNGTNWTNIVTGQSAATGTYAWTVPNISSTTVKLKVTDEVFPNISDESNANFVIVLPSLTLKSPNGDEIMPAGSQFLINWDAEYLDFFIIEFTSDGGVTWQILSEGYFNVAYYNWVVPDISSLNCKVRIRAQNLPHYSDESDYPFTIENGLNWTKLPTDFNFLFSDVKFISADTGWVVGEFGKILHTTDGGDSWVDQLSGTDFHLRSVDFTSSKIGYILAIDNDYEGNILLKTVDGGLHWLDINSFHGTR
ncbi:MAG: FG-GAP-like repeat-containing protein, partial [Ignavibacteriales bacterium]|nr:FG-GAP-like repeat-containing protein [Ignavibacteriales bacterium]